MNLSSVVRRLSAVLPVWFGAFFVFPFLPAALPSDASISREAWWSFYNPGLPAATPTTVPADALGVGHNLAQPDKVAALGITLQAPLGSAVQTLKLDLKEAAEPLANIGAASAQVVACPVTGPWEPVINGGWADVPSYDCGLGKVAGQRSEEGIWTFDLTPIGSQWLSADFPLEQAGILFLIEAATQPQQVSFRSIKTGDFRLEFAASAPDSSEPVEPVVVGELDVPAPPAEPEAAGPAPAPEEPAPAVLVTQPTRSQGENIPDPNILGNQPWGTWLLLPLLLAAAAAVSYALGPGRDRIGSAHRREGPVSRALAREEEGR